MIDGTIIMQAKTLKGCGRSNGGRQYRSGVYKELNAMKPDVIQNMVRITTRGVSAIVNETLAKLN